MSCCPHGRRTSPTRRTHATPSPVRPVPRRAAHPDLDASVAFARDILGLDVVAEEGDSVYLRCWGDLYRYSLVLTAAAEPGLGHGAWRAWNAEQLDVAVASVEAAGVTGDGWTPPSATGALTATPARPATPRSSSGTSTARSRLPARIPYPERPQRTGSRGIGVRILDHLTVTAPDVKAAAFWHQDVLDFRVMGGVEGEPGAPWFLGLISCNEKSHDFGFILDGEGTPGRLHHVAFWVETNHDLTRGAKFLVEHGHDIDFGPASTASASSTTCTSATRSGSLRAQLRRLPQLRPRLGAGHLALRGRPEQPTARDRHAGRAHGGDPPGLVGRHDEMIQGIVAKG